MTKLDSASIIHRYRDLKEAPSSIAADLGCTQDAIYNLLDDAGIKRDLPGGSPKTPDEKVKKIIQLYDEGMGATSIGRQMGVDKKTVYNILVRAGKGTRPQHDRKGTTRTIPQGVLAGVLPTGGKRGGQMGHKKALDESVFDVLTDDCAYWLGYLMGDGCISKDPHRPSHRLFLTQSRKHEDHLLKLKGFLKTENLIVYGSHLDPAGKKQDHCALSVTSETICLRLIQYGVTMGKSERKVLDSRLLSNRHFWRGCVDADGCVYGNDQMYLSGHLPLLEQWEAAITLQVKAESPTRAEQPGCWCFRSYGSSSRAITAWLYQPGDLSLPAKLRRSHLSRAENEKTPG